MTKTSTGLIIVLFIGLAFSLFRIGQLEGKLAALPMGAQAVQGHDDIELAVQMGYLQRFADKLYFAGQAENWPLADFYLHEIEETAAVLTSTDLYEEDIHLNPLVESMLVSQVEALEATVDAADRAQFDAAYISLIQSCNACHGATNHAFVRIQTPEASTYTNQDFRPISAQ